MKQTPVLIRFFFNGYKKFLSACTTKKLSEDHTWREEKFFTGKNVKALPL
ncbi:MAG: hypothetical protein IJ681_02440 [Bacteroidales bacterium]|nr:hypothetical protein [Bacteroidales bacterium]